MSMFAYRKLSMFWFKRYLKRWNHTDTVLMLIVLYFVVGMFFQVARTF